MLPLYECTLSILSSCMLLFGYGKDRESHLLFTRNGRQKLLERLYTVRKENGCLTNLQINAQNWKEQINEQLIPLDEGEWKQLDRF